MTLSIPEGFTSIHDSNQVHKKLVLEASGPKASKLGTTVRVHYEGSLYPSGEVFDSSLTRSDPLEFQIGKGRVIKGWDLGIATMAVGEKAELLIQAPYAYGTSGSPPKIPANAVLLFKVELVSMDESTAEMSISEKLEKAAEAKKEGNTVFATGEYQKAADFYKRGLNLLKETFGADGDDESKGIASLKVTLNSNLAMCLLKLKDGKEAAKACENVFEIEPDHAKANYRYFQALVQQGLYDQALSFLDEKSGVMGDIDVNSEKNVLKKYRNADLAKEKAVYSKMFAA